MATNLRSLEASVEATLTTLREQAQQRRAQPFTIFRIPAYVRESNRTAYEPRMVSIGPYYHGAAALRAMEDHKWCCLHDFLSRNTAVSSSTLIEEMRYLEARARGCYSEQPALGSDDFVRMLLLDGSFILEFFIKWHTKEPDALRDVGWGLTLVTSDLLLLENPIPLFVLERLYGVIAGIQGTRELLFNLLLEYLDDEEPFTRPSGAYEFHQECFVPKVPLDASERVIPRARRFLMEAELIPRATELMARNRGD